MKKCPFQDVKVVVGSGINDYYGGDIEIYSQRDNSFQNGPPLPKPLEGAASVQYGDSFIVVGGYDYDCYCDNSGINVLKLYPFCHLLISNYSQKSCT